MDLGRTVRAAGGRFGPRTLIVDPDGGRLSFAELDRRSEALGRGLRRAGLTAGDVVALCLPSTSDFLVSYAAAAKVGAVATGVNPRLSGREVDAVVDTARPAVVLSTREQVAELELPGAPLPELPPDPDRAAAIVFTSGTTGQPKGALFLERQLAAVTALDVGDVWGDPADDPVPMLATTQFGHIGMMTKFPWYLRRGMTIHVLGRWEPGDALATVAEHRIPSIGGVAPMIAMMLAEPSFDRYDLDCVRTMVVGGAPSAPGLVREARQRFGAAYSNRYSSTESGGCGTAVPFDSTDEDEILNTAGRPRGPVEIAICDDSGARLEPGEVGEIWLRSPTQFVRYWNNPEATARTVVDGWVRTGDLGSLDPAGRLRPAGRCKEAYIRGGYNVHPAEVEAQIREHPDVADVAVVPRSDPRLGEVGVAAVVPSPGSSPPTLAELRSFLRDRLARYKQPDEVCVLEALPLTAMDKVDRPRLEQLMAGTRTSTAGGRSPG
jgi:acyl-CoA synthetase (AMP-forming)/AMP-acid ligase II